MKKFLLLFISIGIAFCLPAQETQPTKKKKDWSKVKLTGRANDHLMLQLGVTNWSGKPDSIKTTGISRSFNMYFLIDFPFKTDPRFSVALGPGFGTDHIFFDKTNITHTNHQNPLQFQNLADTNHFDKYKLVNAFLELPVELRFCLNPENTNKSFKVALGAKVGVQVSAHTKGKRWVDKDGDLVAGFDDKYVQKNKDKYFFNGNRLVGMLRIGYGVLSLYGSYQLGSLVKEGLGPQVKPYSIGLTISGL
jgi:hypothetical protein